MRVIQSGKYFRVLPDSEIEARQMRHKLMGWRQRKNDPWIVAEDNLVNRIVMEQDVKLLYYEPVMSDTIDSRLKDYQDCVTTFQNWSKSIFNTFDYPYTNGFTEGCNNKIKVLKRNAYGYRNFNRFRKRILHMFNYKKSNIGKAVA